MPFIDIKTNFEETSLLKIGSSADCDIILKSRTVSKIHASIEKITQNEYRLKDLGSLKGVIVNDKKIKSVKINETTIFTIGSFTGNIKNGLKDKTSNVIIRADKITKTFSQKLSLKQTFNKYIKGKNPKIKKGFNDLTFEVPAGIMVAILGPSGCGKTTLLKTLIGETKLSNGKITIGEDELNDDNYEYLRQHIGYVSQKDNIHKLLTVEQAIKYAAHLRLPDADTKQIDEKINEVLYTLKIDKIRKNKISEISGGQEKRVSIAIEILTDPKILFLDEPTSPLDPQTIEDFLLTLRGLCNKDMSIIMVTHKPEDLVYMDKAIFMAEGGSFAYYADAKSYLKYFKEDDVVKVYSKLVGNEAKYWIDKYKKENPYSSIEPKSIKLSQNKQSIFFYPKQYYWLTLRYFNIKINDPANLFMMIAQAPIIAGLICLIFQSINQVLPFFIAISAIWFGSNNAAREIVSEALIFKRERNFNQGILPYLFSKLTVLSIISTIQSIIFTIIIFYYFKYKLVPWNNPQQTFIFMTVLSIASTLMGLLLSAIVNSTEKVMTILPLTLIPQIMLAGVIVKINYLFVEILSYFTLSRWGTIGFAKIQKKISVPNHVFDPITKTIIEDTKDKSVNATDVIFNNFHNSFLDTFKRCNNQVDIDYLIIVIIMTFFFTFTFFSLKEKDTYKIN